MTETERSGAQILMYVPWKYTSAFMNLGWIPHNSLQGTHHAQYVCLMEWVKEGEPEKPDMSAA